VGRIWGLVSASELSSDETAQLMDQIQDSLTDQFHSKKSRASCRRDAKRRSGNEAGYGDGSDYSAPL
jgi:hypothetical protein